MPPYGEQFGWLGLAGSSSRAATSPGWGMSLRPAGTGEMKEQLIQQLAADVQRGMLFGQIAPRGDHGEQGITVTAQIAAERGVGVRRGGADMRGAPPVARRGPQRAGADEYHVRAGPQ